MDRQEPVLPRVVERDPDRAVGQLGSVPARPLQDTGRVDVLADDEERRAVAVGPHVGLSFPVIGAAGPADDAGAEAGGRTGGGAGLAEGAGDAGAARAVSLAARRPK